MVTAEIPADERARLEALASLDILDTPSDEILDGLVRTAASVVGCPVSAISLIDERRQWFKARVGLDPSETSRDIALCAHTILQNGIFEVPDCWTDSRFKDNPLVTGSPPLRFYAGIPIAIDGQNVGVFCLMDHVPRQLSASQRAILEDLGRAARHWFESWRQQKLLAESVPLGNMLFENPVDGVVLIDRAFQIRDANAQAMAMLRYERRQLIGQPLSAVFADGKGPGQGANSLCIAGPLRECTMVRKDGSHFPAETYSRFVNDRGFLVVVRDVTERHARERLLRQHSLAIEQSFAGVLICDLDGTVVYANDAALRMSGYSKSELIGRNQRMLESPGVPAEQYESIREIVRSGRRFSGLLHSRRKDGSDFAQFARISPVVTDEGGLANVVIVSEDLTEKQRLSIELDQYRNHLDDLVSQRTAELASAKRAAEAASHAKSDFLASMSHEIRTPMNGVLGIVEVLRASLDPHQLELADTIRDSALALLGIIDEVLDFSKIEAGQLQLKREPVELLALAENVCDALLPLATSRGVSLDVFVSPDLPATIVSDNLRLRQLLNNLLGNAIKFSSNRSRPGRVWLRIEPRDSGTFRMIVGDNGIGMAPHVQKLVFEPFVQAEATTTRRFGGTGLGLTICRKLVDLFGGTIQLKSAPDKGSIFKLTFPMASTDSHPAGADAKSGRLEGLHCHVVLRNFSRARNWAAYLIAAGGTAKAWRKCPSLQAASQEHENSRHVFLIDSDDPASESLQAGCIELGIPLVQVHPGAARGSQMIRHAMVSMESGAVRRATLVDAVALASGRSSPTLPSGRLPVHLPVVPDRAEAAAQGRLILVAEDNDLNQKVIEQQLALLGHSADMAVNGEEALERWRTGTYGLLLTDLHMPLMDGYTLTAQIRSEEASRAGSSEGAQAHLPILALTANALRGEAERCLSIGMDDYLTKPLQLEPLSAALARWLPQPGPAAPGSIPTDVEETDADASDGDGPLPVYDATMLPKLLGDDPKVLAEVRTEFVLSARETTRSLRIAVANGESATIRSLAHRQKASARAIGAMALGECCVRLEQATTSSDPCPAFDPLLGEFEAALALLLSAMGYEEEKPETEPKAPPVAEVIVVDDEPFQLDLIQQQLRLCSLPVLAYNSATAALASLEKRDTSAMLLLFDLNMPEMDGVELMRHLAERRYAGAIALISGADTRVLETASKLATAYHLNVLSYLHKPVTTGALGDLLDRWRTVIPARSPGESKAYGAAEIRQGIARDELVLQYQPKVSLEDGSLVGVEALVRWLHPTDGIVYPDRFIEVAESHDLIDDLTYAVLEKAMAQARLWRDGGLDLRVAVNISMRNLVNLDFPERVLEIVERHGMAPDDLQLEVTESTLMSDARGPLNTLTRLRLRAVGMSIDDFGTGHSSLAQLRDIPFDELKIDRGFVHQVGRQPTQQAIFLASLNMAHQLDMKVVAEGVEDAADWEFVRDAGCDVAQGYFISRPMNGSALAAWATTWEVPHQERRDVR